MVPPTSASYKVRQFFKFDDEKNVQICQINNCLKRISGDHAANMIRHVETLHKEFFVSSNLALLRSVKRKHVRKIPKVVVDPNKIIMNNLKKPDNAVDLIWQGCVEMVAQSGLSYSFISSSGFHKIISPLLSDKEQLRQFTSDNLREKISEIAASVRRKIAIDCKDGMVCLKIDTANYLGRGILGVHVQYINDDSDLIKLTLATREIKIDYTPVFIADQICSILNEFNISLNQIYSITIDNDENMVKTSQNICKIEDVLETNDSVENSNSDSKMFDESSMSENNFDQECDDNNIFFEILTQAVNEILKTALQTGNFIISEIRCGSYIIDWMIDELLSQSELHSKIEDCRKIVIALQDPRYLTTMKINNIRVPILNNPSRNRSILDMIERLLDLKIFFSEQLNIFPGLSSIDLDWDFLTLFITAFHPIKTIFMKLECNQIFYSNFFKYWLELKFELRKMSSNMLANKLSSLLETKEKEILSNSILVSAIYLDPRFKFLLTHTQNEQACTHLKALYDHIQKINTNKFDISNVKQEDEEQIMPSPEETSDLSDFLKLLESQRKQIDPHIPNQMKCYSEIENYRESRLEPQTNIMEYWLLRKSEYSHLYNLVKIINAVPASQASVEKTFSALKYILNDNGENSNVDEMLEDVLLVRLNAHLLSQ